MADLDFGKLSHGNAIVARRFWIQHPERCAVIDTSEQNGSVYIIGHDGKRLQAEAWKRDGKEWIHIAKPKKRKVRDNG